MQVLLLVLLLSLPGIGNAQKVSYPAHKLSSAGVNEIRITGVKGKLNLRHRPGKFFFIKVKHTKGERGEDWHLSMDRQGNALVMEVFSTELGREWRRQVRKELWPEFDIEIDGPAKPSMVAWREGRIEVEGWTEPLDISFLEGSFKSKRTSGALKVQAGNADVFVTDHKGSLSLKGERGRLEMVNVQGQQELHWMSGSVRAERCSGRVTLESTDAELNIQNSAGDWSVKLASGFAKLLKMSGKVTTTGNSSDWDMSLSSPAEAEFTTRSGQVAVKWLSGTVKLFLSSQKGEIQVPKKFAVEERSGGRVVEANQKAKGASGTVFVKTESGKIIWRE